jgi:hypothetical protein
MFKIDYPDLRAYLASQEAFEYYMKKNAYVCDIQDNEAITAVQMLDFNNKVSPSTIVIMKDDGSYQEFWYEVYINQENIPYDVRLASYSKYYLVY